MKYGSFDALSPDLVYDAVEGALDAKIEGPLQAYPSYVNRVYGMRCPDESGDREIIVKFYRPGRWTREAVLEEHEFVLDCAKAEIPVVAPIATGDGDTLHELILESGGSTPEGEGEIAFRFALYPKRAGRGFDAERDEDWIRMGSVLGRIHLSGSGKRAIARHRLEPVPESVAQARYLLDSSLVHPDAASEFEEICMATLEGIAPEFEGSGSMRIHGDFHRGNILDRPGEGLTVIDFDDMASGPAIQDVWLLLPGYAHDCGRELGLIAEGYGRFLPFPWSTVPLIEPLRFMRMLYFLSWRARQKDDRRFAHDNPDWGTRSFWIKEVEDLRTQALTIFHSPAD